MLCCIIEHVFSFLQKRQAIDTTCHPNDLKNAHSQDLVGGGLLTFTFKKMININNLYD
uniref:Uncharacterized protein n=1 Tax=Myoviridae sp. ctoNH1 TaxID=2826695 RepID=A0A8S5QSS4_9CAUD|nr:MAG TPA: hypothetical protein [Myoviridae sp. ctoNH1]